MFENKSTVSLFFERLTPEASRRVSYLKDVPYNEIKVKIEKANVVVLPSFAEAFPMTWLETLSMEKALVSSNIGWAKELMVDKTTGFTVKPRDHETFAAKIITLLKHPELCDKFGKAGRERVIDKFSSEKVTQQNIEFYKSVIN